MMSPQARTRIAATVTCLLALWSVGCQQWKQYYQHPTPAPLGTISDPVWQTQEANAERSDFVVYQHEFQRNAEWLNTAGEDHVKQIAARLLSGQDAQVVVERSMTTARADTKHKYPIHPNPELDMRRREIISRSLVAMGVEDAEDRVVVAPALTPGATASEAEAAYRGGFGASPFGGGGLGSGGGFGGFMFGGGGLF